MGVGSQRWWRQQALSRLWSIHTPVVLVVKAEPEACLQTLAIASRPSTQRLHLRFVFTSGRRYEVARRDGGFQLKTTSKVSWHYRRRTTSAAVLTGALEPIAENLTRVQIKARISADCFFNTLMFPSALALIIGSVPWPLPILSALLSTIYALSWIGNRANAALEVQEMVYFIQKALEDLGMGEMPTLVPTNNNPDVVYDRREFARAWEKFYHDHADEPRDGKNEPQTRETQEEPRNP